MVDVASAGLVLGLFSGLVLVGLFVAALATGLRPLFGERNPGTARALLWLTAIAIGKFALLGSFPGYWDDVRCWNLWSSVMAYAGPTRIYEPQFMCDYPPGYLYVLWPVGWIVRALGLESFDSVRLVAESPPLIVDFIMGLAIFATIRKLGAPRSAFAGMLLFALNPALLFDTVAWGQSDSVLALPILLSAMLAADARYELAWAMAATAVLIKPQGLVLLPILGLWTLLRGERGDWLGAVAAFAGVIMVGIAPFQIGHRWNFILNVYLSAAGRYPATSDNAFNLMGLLGGLQRPDSTPIAGVSAFTLGMTLFLSAYAAAAYILYRKPAMRSLLLSIFLAYLAMFVLAPRIHERYMYPALAILIPLAVESPITLWIFAALSGTFLFNLALVKRYHEHELALEPNSWLAGVPALINLAALAVALVYAMGYGQTAAAQSRRATRE